MDASSSTPREQGIRNAFGHFVTEQLRGMLENRSIRISVLGVMLVVASVFSLAPTGIGVDPGWMFILPVAVASVAGGVKEGMVVALAAALLGALFVAASQGDINNVVIASVASARCALFGLTAAILGAFAEAHHSVQSGWKDLASTDPLTKVANITKFYDELGLVESVDEKFALLLLDIDDLKVLNDAHSHQAGSAAIQAVARVLRMVVRGSDCVARYGGDEFVVILRNADRAGAQIVVNRISMMVHDEILPIAPGATLSVSVGVAIFGEDGRTSQELVAAADAAMYDNKRSRKVGRPALAG